MTEATVWYLQVRISDMKTDIARWNMKAQSETNDFAKGMYRGQIIAIEPVLKEYERLLERAKGERLDGTHTIVGLPDTEERKAV